MSSEVCPFCGKTFKRLKSHLPHCKAAASSKTAPSKHNVSTNQTLSSAQLSADTSKPRSEGKETTQTQTVVSKPPSRKGRKVSEVSDVPTIASQSESESSVLSLSSSTKKKKQKLSELIRAAKIASSTSAVSTPSQSQSPNISEPKKKSLRALIEAEKFKLAHEGAVEETRSSQDLPLGSNPLVADTVNSRIKKKTDSKTQFDKDHVKNKSTSDFLFTDLKSKNVSTLEATKRKKAKTTKDTSLDLKEPTEKLHFRDDFLFQNEEEAADLSVNKMFSKSGSGHRARITLQDVKTTLARANGTRQASRPSILSNIQTTDDLKSKIKPAPPVVNKENSLITHQTMPDQLRITNPQQTEIQSVKRESFKSQQAALIPFQQNVSPLSGITPSEAPVLQVKQATPLPFSVTTNENLKAGPYKTGLLTISPSLVQFSSPHPPRSTPPTLSAREEGVRADGSQLEVRSQNTAENRAKGALAERSLGQVRLRELPEWLVCRAPTHPRDVVEMVQRGWQWYYRKYINVKKGGVGGVSMLLAGYCVLSYIWSYPHIKRDRWRKHH